MIRLVKVEPQDRGLLWNINQKYLYEMTSFYEDSMDSDGNYHYGYFDEYFTDPERKAFFLYDGDTLVGFAMINPYSFIGHEPDYVMAEFTVFPSFRRRHFAREAAGLILSSFRGTWEIKFNEKNTAAKLLWMSVAEPYCPVVYHLNEEETVLEFSNEV